MEQTLQHKIMQLLKRAKSRGANRRELFALCHIKAKKRREFELALSALERRNQIVDTGSRVFASEFSPTREAIVTRLNRTYGFARFTLPLDGQTECGEVFIPGRYFHGALPGDTVLVASIPPRGDKPEGKIVHIVKEGSSTFTATLLHSSDGWYLQPDRLMRFDFPIREQDTGGAQPGDKVLCEVVKRGECHSDHRVHIIKSYGDAQTAVNCAQAILELNGVPLDFPEEVRREASEIGARTVAKTDLQGRLDLRDKPIFTIDSAEAKDLDDAVSLRRVENGYELGVHIADVSHYVRPGTALDRDALSRGTSLYFADRVVPMLPHELSNGVCSLTPGEDKLTFSCLLRLDAKGNILHYEFQKSVINSRVKGVYKELNAILAGEAEPELLHKYDGLTESILLMKELADILTANKRERGAPEIESSESAILLDENSHSVGIVPRERGAYEMVIEEFMLTANEAAANYARKRGLPFVYRVHEPPSEDKLETLRTVLEALGLPTGGIKPGVPAKTLSALLRAASGKPYSSIVNQNVLRAMSKAKYLEQPVGHYGLVLEDYAHFTSPIRRYPDLTIHRILSDAVSGMSVPNLLKRYNAFSVESSRQSSATELNAMQLERECEDCYRAEYMRDHLDEEFNGIIISLAPYGFYVELPNTVDGLVRVDSLPEGQYDLDNPIECVNLTSGKKWRIGDTVCVKCVKADVPSGNIDFELL